MISLLSNEFGRKTCRAQLVLLMVFFCLFVQSLNSCLDKSDRLLAGAAFKATYAKICSTNLSRKKMCLYFIYIDFLYYL